VTNASQPTPRVSIGLPVYNGDKFLEQAIVSILGQTFTDFELIISDNASTDRTAEICSRFAKRDPRVRYSRNETNIGGGNNSNLTFRLSRGEYFRWAAHDDICAERLLERCVEVLDRNQDAVLCWPEIVYIDERGQQLRPKGFYQGQIGETPFSRFRFLTSRRHGCEAIYGLIRADYLRRTELMKNYTDSDRVLLCELALLGRFLWIHEPLFYKRQHVGNQYKDWRGRMAWFTPSLAESGKVTFPFWTQYYNYFRAVHKVPISPGQKLLCDLWLLGPWLARYGRAMANDVLVAAQMMSHSKEWRKQKYRDVDRWA